jgi:flagellar biosynthesis/type III secretory pathway chaperone
MKKPTASYNPPPQKELPATVRDLIAVKTSLATLMEEESAYIDKMQISKVGELQDRKLKLTGLLERYMRYMHHHKEVLLAITAEEKTELYKIADTFNKAMQRNREKLMIARAVNNTIVKCVTQIVTGKDNNPVYNARGSVGKYHPKPISVTLNQTI